jgi:hypothetical protein
MSKHYYPWTPPQPIKTDDPAGRMLESIVKSLLKEQKKAEKKKDEKKPDDKSKTFTYLELTSILILCSPIFGALELFMIKAAGVVLMKALQ